MQAVTGILGHTINFHIKNFSHKFLLLQRKNQENF